MSSRALVLPTRYKTARAKAIDQGLSEYEGRACAHCHTKRRRVRDQKCLTCIEQGSTYYNRHSEEQKVKMRAQSRRKWRENRPSQLLQQAKYRAKKFARDFNLTEDDITIPEICPVLGTPMTSPSLDRKDNALGYVRGNVFVISLRANTLKNDANIAELEAILAYMKA